MLLVLLLLGAANGQAQGLKIGFTDPEAVIVNLPDYAAVRQQLQNEYEAHQQALQVKAADFQDKLDKYQKQQALLSPESRAQRETELQQLQQEIQTEANQKDQLLASRENELMRPLLEKVQQAIDTVAKEKALDVVMRAPGLLYVNPATVVDITADVARKLGLPVVDAPSASTDGTSN
jgi:outer membrane protein